MADVSDELDQLLDSALDDFTKLDLDPVAGRRGGGGEAAAPVRGLGGLGLPDLKARRNRYPAPPLPTTKAPRRDPSHAAEALEKLTRQTREAVRGLESTTSSAEGGGDSNDEGMEEFVKQLEELTGAQGMESIVETMMQQLLSKDLLQEPMKEMGEKYPRWLEEHKATLSKEEYDRYYHQYEVIIKLNDVYENDPDNFQKIVDLMQKMQECGQPPIDIVNELAPGLDPNDLGQLSPELLESTGGCCIM